MGGHVLGKLTIHFQNFLETYSSFSAGSCQGRFTFNHVVCSFCLKGLVNIGGSVCLSDSFGKSASLKPSLMISKTYNSVCFTDLVERNNIILL